MGNSFFAALNNKGCFGSLMLTKFGSTHLSEVYIGQNSRKLTFKKGINTYQSAKDYSTISEALDVSNSVRYVLLKLRQFAIILSFSKSVHLVKITIKTEHKMAKENLWICRSISSRLKFMTHFQKNVE